MMLSSNAELVSQLIAKRIIQSETVANVMRTVDRRLYQGSYTDSPQGIGYCQTISAPHMHAMCLELINQVLKPGDKVLDVGSGSGYLTTCLAHLVGETGSVIGLETIPELVSASTRSIQQDRPDFLQSGRVKIIQGDGWKGVPSEAPFQVIHVGAAAREVPKALLDQLKPGGRMLIPVGHQDSDQYLMEYDKSLDNRITSRRVCGVRYVPLVEKE